MRLLTNPIHDQLLRNGRPQVALAEEGRAEADLPAVIDRIAPSVETAFPEPSSRLRFINPKKIADALQHFDAGSAGDGDDR